MENTINSSSENLFIGNRIPQDFFITKGTGESDTAIHAGSYYQALKKAGIGMCNVLTYSSSLPKIAREVEQPAYIEHGTVMECIMAVCNSRRGQRATAGIIYGWLYDRDTSEKYGALVCENYGYYDVHDLAEMLESSLDEMYCDQLKEKYRLSQIRILTESFIPKKTYGTSIVALCFLNYVYPVIQKENQ